MLSITAKIYFISQILKQLIHGLRTYVRKQITSNRKATIWKIRNNQYSQFGAGRNAKLNIRYFWLNPKLTRKDLKITFVCVDNISPIIGICNHTDKPAIALRLHQGIVMPFHVNPCESHCTIEKSCVNSSCPINKTSETKINKWMTPTLKKWLNEDWPEISDQYHAALEKDPSATFVRVHLKSGGSDE